MSTAVRDLRNSPSADPWRQRVDAGWAPFMNRQWPKFVSPHLHGLVFNGTYFELFPSMWLSQ